MSTGTRTYTNPPRTLGKLTAADFGVRVFHGILCDRCKAGLHDRDGNPRWDVVGKLQFVCLGGCPDKAPPQWRQR